MRDTMSSRNKVVTTFEPEHVIQPIYTGGDVALDKNGHVLATCLGEEAVLTDLRNGQLLARIEGVCCLPDSRHRAPLTSME